MTVNTGNYTLGANQPLHHSRVLWNDIVGTFPTGCTGTNPDRAANDYTNQRWDFNASAVAQTWTLTTAANAPIDTIIIAGHNLGTIGASLSIGTSAFDTDAGGAIIQRVAPFAVLNDTPIGIMFNSAGSPYTIRRFRLTIPIGPTIAGKISIIRGGVALQMIRPLGNGAEPIGLRPQSVIRHIDTDSGQWAGRVIQRRRYGASIGWGHLDAAWYRSTFAPFAETIPANPFGLIQNAVSMPESVAWCWTNDDPAPSYSEGKRLNFSMNLVGFAG